MRRPAGAWWAGLAVLGLLLAGCSGSDGAASDATDSHDTASRTGAPESDGSGSTGDAADATVTDPPAAQGAGPEVGDHVHHAFGIQYCDRFEPNPTDAKGDVTGIHTHGDGLIHVHPYDESAAGDSATLGLFFDDIGATIGDETSLPGGENVRIGDDECGDDTVVVRVARWNDALAAADGSPPDAIYTKDFGSIPLTGDLGAYTVAFLPPGTEIRPPPSAGDICKLAISDGGRVGDRCQASS